jgi:hypothetical protein
LLNELRRLDNTFFDFLSELTKKIQSQGKPNMHKSMSDASNLLEVKLAKFASQTKGFEPENHKYNNPMLVLAANSQGFRKEGIFCNFVRNETP